MPVQVDVCRSRASHARRCAVVQLPVASRGQAGKFGCIVLTLASARALFSSTFLLRADISMVVSAASPRAALLISGHLRDTCDTPVPFDTLLEQISICDSIFEGACDTFIHTWTTLDATVTQPPRYWKQLHIEPVKSTMRGTDSYACTQKVFRAIQNMTNGRQPTAVAIKRQNTSQKATILVGRHRHNGPRTTSRA